MNESDEEHSSLDHILHALLNEAVRSRMRNRALLHVLVNKGALEMREYVEAYRAQEEQNFGVLVDMLLLAPEDFHERHADWLAHDRTLFGYRSDSYPDVHLRPANEPAGNAARVVSETPSVKPKGKRSHKKS